MKSEVRGQKEKAEGGQETGEGQKDRIRGGLSEIRSAAGTFQPVCRHGDSTHTARAGS